MTEMIKRIEEFLNKATPGPWNYLSQTVWAKSIGGCRKEMSEHKVADLRGWGHLQYLGEEKAIEIQDSNGELICLLRNSIESLLAERKRLEKVRVACEMVIKHRSSEAWTDLKEALAQSREDQGKDGGGR